MLDVDDLLEMLTVSCPGLPEPLEDEEDSDDRCFLIPAEVLVVISLLLTERSSLSETSITEVEIARN